MLAYFFYVNERNPVRRKKMTIKSDKYDVEEQGMCCLFWNVIFACVSCISLRELVKFIIVPQEALYPL